MRRANELTFRAAQELANLRLWLTQPSVSLKHDVSVAEQLPDPVSIIERLRGTVWSSEVEHLAGMILQHRFPLAGGVLEAGERIGWRRDYKHGIASDTSYFRLIPYLDFERVGDHKLVWDLNRHQHLVVLAQAFLLTGGGIYLVEIARQIDSWLDDNPYMRGINWTSALEVAFRALSWVWVFHLVGRHLNEPFRRKLLTALYRHGCYIESNLSVFFSPNTHLLGEAVALHALGALFQFPGGDRWKKTGAEVTNRQMEAQVRHDGSHFEQSSYYHVYALDLFLFHRLLCESNPALDAKIRSMANYLDCLMGPARALPLIGDDDGGRVFHPYGRCDHFGRATLATCSLLLNDSNWVYDENDVHVQAAWWLGERAFAHGAVRAEARQESRVFRQAGLADMTSGATSVLVDAGPFGPGAGGHSHSDSLSVIVRSNGENVLVDAGTFTYVSDPKLRDWFRGSAAHNTVRLDGRDQAIPVSPFKWVDKPDVELLEWATSSECDLIDAICRYQGPGHLSHRRRVMFLKSPIEEANTDVLIITDRIDGAAGLHLIEQYWHPGEAHVSVSGNHVRIGTRSHLLVPSGTHFDVEDHWRSEGFGEKAPVKALVVRSETPLPVTIWAVLSVGDGRQPVALEAESAGEAANLQLANGCTIKIRLDSAGRLRSSLERSSSR